MAELRRGDHLAATLHLDRQRLQLRHPTNPLTASHESHQSHHSVPHSPDNQNSDYAFSKLLGNVLTDQFCPALMIFLITELPESPI